MKLMSSIYNTEKDCIKKFYKGNYRIADIIWNEGAGEYRDIEIVEVFESEENCNTWLLIKYLDVEENVQQFIRAFSTSHIIIDCK